MGRWTLALAAMAMASAEALVFSDQRLKDNLTRADSADLLAAVRSVELWDFDYKFEQFFNPVFGKRQLGVVAQELKRVMPRAVGIVPRRAIGGPEDDEPTVLEDVHVFNSETLFMANLGATQELAVRGDDLQKRIGILSDALLKTSEDASQAKEAKAELLTLRSRQTELETLAKEAHHRSEGAAKIEQVVQAMERDAQAQRSHSAVVDAKLEAMEKAADKSQAALEQAQKELRDALRDVKTDLDALTAKVRDLEAQVQKQAGEEIVEKRKTLEAQARLEEARIELARTQAEEQRKTAAAAAELEVERQARQDNLTLARRREEEALRGDSEARLVEVKLQAALQEEAARAENERELVRARAAAELERARLESATARETAAATAAAETQRERDNHDLRKEMAVLEAEQQREHTAAAIRTAAAEAVEAARLVSRSPEQVLAALCALVLLAFGIYAAREAMVLWRSYMQMHMGQPSLVRETSMRGPLVTSARGAWRIAQRASKRIARAMRPAAAAGDCSGAADESFSGFMKDVVVLEARRRRALERIAHATRGAHDNGTPLRHLLLYGPPGTGKTLVARMLAQWCDLDYAILSGADVAPLRDRAVTELHALFAWARRSPRGLLLFIDEADAFLASRDRGDLSESLRNALTALLFHTGSASSRVMLVLASNRPGDLDRAVLDRVDEQLQFDLPGLEEREQLVRQYYRSTLSTLRSEVSDGALREAARQTRGFSGREISKLMLRVQAHVLGTAGETLLTDKLFRGVLFEAVEQHGKLGAMHLKADYSDLFSAPDK